VNCGSPIAVVVADIMCSTRKKYHLAVRRLRYSQNDIQNSKIAEAHLHGSSTNFWQEVKRSNARKSIQRSSNVVNGHTSAQEIANDFKDVFTNIFRADFTSDTDISTLRSLLNDKCSVQFWEGFSLGELLCACKLLKPNKNDSDMNLNSSAIINAPQYFFEILYALINAVVWHGHAPESWLCGSIIPLLKSSTLDKSHLSSYRPITLSSLFGKIVDILVLNRYRHIFI
jgi:hypothetical protein